MIPIIGGWRVERGVGALTFVHPEGADRARIVYRERVRPQRRLRRLLVEHLGALAAGARLEALVTAEGEHAVHATAVEAGGRVRHDLGLVFVDDYTAVVRAAFGRPEDHARFGEVFRALILADNHGLTGRRRRFVYTPPSGWQGLARGLETHWIPPEYPRRMATLSVPPALAQVVDAPAYVESRLRLDLAAGFEPTEVRAPEPIACGPGLEGVSQAVTGRLPGGQTFVREVAVLSDKTNTYPLLFDCAGPLDERAATRRVFRDVVRSVLPLPSRRPAVADDILSLWGE